MNAEIQNWEVVDMDGFQEAELPKISRIKEVAYPLAVAGNWGPLERAAIAGFLDELFTETAYRFDYDDEGNGLFGHTHHAEEKARENIYMITGQKPDDVDLRKLSLKSHEMAVIASGIMYEAMVSFDPAERPTPVMLGDRQIYPAP